MCDMDEQALITAAQKKDMDAFNRLVLEYQQSVYNVAVRMLNDLDAADDATQQAFVAAYQKIHTFQGGSFKAWIMRIVTNKCYDMLRKQQRYPTQSIDASPYDPDEEMESGWYLEDDALLPEEQVVMRELEAAVQQCIEQLPQEFKATVVLVDIQGLNYEEAAFAMKTPLGTIKSRLARARGTLQDCLHKFKELLPHRYRSTKEGSHE